MSEGASLPWDKLREACGVVAVWSRREDPRPEARWEPARLASLALHALQHRGQESAGIASSSARGAASTIHTLRAMGEANDIFTAAALRELTGRVAIGHTRYSTCGDSAVNNAQPIQVECNKGRLAIAHNGNLVNAAEIRHRLEAQGSIFQTTSDTEVILHLLAQSRAANLDDALAEALNQVEGAYSLVLLAPDCLYAIRDPWGFRPLARGQLSDGGGEVFASETCAFDLIGARFEGDVPAGHWVKVSDAGVEVRRFGPPRPLRQCVFEHVYFSRPDSIVFERSVQQSREQLGRILAREAPANADVVVPVPDSGTAAALGYAAEAGLPCRFGLIRSHYVGRTFIEPTQENRDLAVRLKLNPVRALLEGQRVVLVDDSIVRGTTSHKIVAMIRAAGAAEVHVRVSCPPTIAPCHYGVDTPSRGELIASSQSVEQIQQSIGADSLAYLSLAGLAAAVGGADDFCRACYTGDYPTGGKA